ncbi:MAG: SDR family oxidoreductase [Janthinobacterium lividum]
MKKALIIGGSGVLGTALAYLLQARQVDFCIGSRRQFKSDSYSPSQPDSTLPWRRVDLLTGEGLAEALAGVDTVFHLASDQRQVANEPFEVVATRHLLAALQRSNVQHLLYSSIVGVEVIPLGYYQAKLAAEQLIQHSGLPYTIVRATQFHQFVESLLAKLLKFPIGLVPRQLVVQPIDALVVAQALLAAAQRRPQEGILAIAGPAVLDFGTLASSWLASRHLRKPLLNIPLIGEVMHCVARGAATDPAAATPSRGWFDYLAEKYPTSVAATPAVGAK